MNQFVESLKRLYSLGKINQEKLKSLLKENKLTQEEYNYITQ